MKKRLITGIFIVLIFVPFLLIEIKDEPIFTILGFFMAILGAFEMLRMYQRKQPLSKMFMAIVGFLTGLMYFFVSGYWFDHNLMLANNITPLVIVVTLVMLLLYVVDKKLTSDVLSQGFVTIFYVGIGAGSLVLLRYIGLEFVVVALLITTLTDVFAYVFGVLFGKHKMALYISPKKSYEGAIGGTVVATIVVSAFVYLFKGSSLLDTSSIFGALGVLNESGFVQIVTSTLLIIGLSILGQFGDLVASKFKRNYGIKDYSQLMPGHGGILDRFDSIFFVSMAFVVILMIV